MAWTAANRYLTQAEMEGNAREIINYARQENWSKTALAAILGNMQAESTINPAMIQQTHRSRLPDSGNLHESNYHFPQDTVCSAQMWSALHSR